MDANDFHEKMELCDVCGSFLVIGDTQSRVDAHLLGKQHMGYARIRAAITELRVGLLPFLGTPLCDTTFQLCSGSCLSVDQLYNLCVFTESGLVFHHLLCLQLAILHCKVARYQVRAQVSPPWSPEQQNR